MQTQDAIDTRGDVVTVDEDGQEPVENFRKDPLDEELIEEDRNGNRYLPGTAPPRNTGIENLAERYRDIRDERMGLSREEKQAKEDLIALMKRDNVPVYEFEGLQVKLTEKPNVTVRTAPDEEEETEDTDEDE